MSRPVTFKESDLKRAVKALVEVGLQVTGARITRDGAIEVLTGQPVKENKPLSPLQQWELENGLGTT